MNLTLQAATSGYKRPQAVVPADRRQVVIDFIEGHDQARMPELQNIIGISDGLVWDLLREMASEGTIEKIGNGWYADYVYCNNIISWIGDVLLILIRIRYLKI